MVAFDEEIIKLMEDMCMNINYDCRKCPLNNKDDGCELDIARARNSYKIISYGDKIDNPTFEIKLKGVSKNE